MTRYFCFRFDVDTHRCVRRGVPNLVELGSRIDAPFTFFVNMGRAVSRTRLLLGRGGADTPRTAPRTAAKLPGRVKLGAWDSVVAAVLNPAVGAGSPHVLRDAIDAGHEVGLHGGTNHAEWQAEAHRWTPERIRGQVAAAKTALVAAVGHEPAGFASPGWNSPAPLPSILRELGFRYLADLHGPATGAESGGPVAAPVPGLPPLAAVRTAISAEPGGVAYLENLRARGLDAPAIRADFRDRLQRAGRLAVVYDHPYFAGIQELELVAELVQLARDMGFRPVPLAHAVNALVEPSG